MHHLTTLLLGGIICLPAFTNCAKILVLSCVPSPSHSLWFNSLTKLLLVNNHEVTLVDTLENSFQHANLSRMVLENAYDIDINLKDLDELTKGSSPLEGIEMLYRYYKTGCPRIEAWSVVEGLRGKRFELIISDGTNCEFLFGLIPFLGSPPFLVATPFGSPQIVMQKAGHYENPSVLPKHMTPFVHPMPFKERCVNTLLVLYQMFLDNVPYMRAENELAKKYFGESCPPLEEISKNTSVFLVNSLTMLEGVRPHYPNVISIGGFQVPTSPEPLDKELESFLDGAKEGAIYFSLGTNIMSSDMSEQKKDMILSALRELPQRFLWKWNGEDIPNKPPNVLISKWFSQTSILAHKNVKGFLSHGGLLSSQESIYYGVPMVVLPFFIDQVALADKLSRAGVAVRLNYNTLTKDAIKRSIQEIVKNPRYSRKMKEWSVLMRDAPQTPRERAMFWIEYVLRHGGAHSLRPPTIHTPLYQYFLVDVISFLALVTLLPIVLFYKIVQRLCRSKTPRDKLKRH